MKMMSQIDTSAACSTDIMHSATYVCMHVLGCARTDVRVMREATALVKSGFNVSIVDIERSSAVPAEEVTHCVRLNHIIMPGWFVPTRFKPLFLIKALRMLIRRTFRLMRVPADVYHAHDETALTACFIAARLRRKPLIFDAHEYPLFESPLSKMSRKHRWLRKISKRLLTVMVPRCEGVITVSPQIAQNIHEHYRAPKVSLLRNIPAYQAVPKTDLLRQYLGLYADSRIALFQGNMHPERGLDRLIRAARSLEPGIFIVMMGKGEEVILSQLEELIAREGVADRVKIIPPVPYEDLLNWTASADIGLIIYSPDYSPNIRMCLPNKLFEYLMVGLPVLSSQLDAITEVIKTYDCGQIVTSLAPENIGKTISAMLADHVALARMRMNALEASKHELHWEKESRVLVQLYHNLLTRQDQE